MTTQLVICGDSWACGSWKSHPYGPDHYFEKQLSRYFAVKNYGKGGQSNRNSLLMLSSHITQNKKDLPNTKFLIIQTDPVRDFFEQYQNLPEDANEIFKDISLNQFAEIQIELFYCQLNHIAKQFDITLNLIGGCSDIHPSIEKYKNLNVLCYSWFGLMDKNYKLGIFSDTTKIYDILKFNSSKDHVIVEQITEKTRVMSQEQSKFFDFRDNHPSHAGQDLMINYIINKL